MFFKIDVLKNVTNCTVKHQCWESLFNNVAGLKRPTSLLKETPTQVFSCEICHNFMRNLFYKTPPVAASKTMKQA